MDYLVFKSKMEMRQHVETRRKQSHLDGDDGQLALFSLPGVSTDTNDVTAPELVVDGHKVFLRLVVPDRVRKNSQLQHLTS